MQTTAMLLSWPERYTHVIFADTGGEKDETYWYIENKLKPFCVEQDIEWITVTKDGLPLLDDCIKKGIMPSVTYRFCTKDFKITPIYRYIRQELKATARNPVTTDIGISWDEAHRANYTQRTKYINEEYPLVDKRLTRTWCIRQIVEYGWDVPPKSGCWYCFFNRKAYWRDLWRNDPDKFWRAVELEESYDGKRGAGTLYTKFRFPLRHLTNQGSIDSFLDDDRDDDSCESGHCFT